MFNWLKKLLGMRRELTGDGTWPFSAWIDGDDIIVFGDSITATCFGGAYDPQDNGETASGVSTKPPGTIGCALPVVSSCRSTKGSPLAFKTRIPWNTLVDVTINGFTVHGIPLIDNGPARSASKNGKVKAIDLTPAVASNFCHYMPPSKLASNFEEVGVSFRIIGAAKYAD